MIIASHENERKVLNSFDSIEQHKHHRTYFQFQHEAGIWCTKRIL